MSLEESLHVSKADLTTCFLLDNEGDPARSAISVFPTSAGEKTGDIVLASMLQSNDPSAKEGKCGVNKDDLFE